MLHLLYPHLLQCQSPVQLWFLQPLSISSKPSLSQSNLNLSPASVPLLVRHLRSFCTSTLAAEALYQPGASCTHSQVQKHTWTLSNTTFYIRIQRLAINSDSVCPYMHTLIFVSKCVRNVRVCACACVCLCDDTEEETLWAHRGIRWQTPDIHMLSRVTCLRIPAVSSNRRAYRKKMELDHTHTHTSHLLFLKMQYVTSYICTGMHNNYQADKL